MKVLLYCQYLLGVGHLFRSLRVASALHGHEVILMAGGPPVRVLVPEHVRVQVQPALYSNEHFSTLRASNGKDPELVKQERIKQLFQTMEEFRPDILLTEQYPFGRSLFRFELDPCIRATQRGEFGSVKIICSVRDIISVRADQIKWEKKVLHRLESRFHGVLVHSDPAFLPLNKTFHHVDDIPCPVHYTGFVTPAPRTTTRKELALENGKPLVVAGLGGGRVGHKLALALINAFAHPCLHDCRLLLFPGPLAQNEWLTSLRNIAANTPSVAIMPYAPNFESYVAVADATVGLGGYNTCMEILASNVPAMLWPLQNAQEQELRCRTLERLGACELLKEEDLAKEKLARKIRYRLDAGRANNPGMKVDLSGAPTTARVLETMVHGGRA